MNYIVQAPSYTVRRAVGGKCVTLLSVKSVHISWPSDSVRYS